MSGAETLERTLARGRRRLGLRVGLRRAGWLTLAAILVTEVALAFGATWLLLVVAALGTAALACVLAPPAPSLRLTAAVLDATLVPSGSSATVASGAEALRGEHPRFAPRLVADAEEALAGAPLALLLPLRLPTGLILGGAAALLLPLLLPQARAQPDALTALPDPPSLLAPDALGGGSAEGAASTPDGGQPTKRLQVTIADRGQPAGKDPLAHLPLDVRQALEQRLKELSKDLPAAAGGAAREAKPTEQDDALTQALRDADAEGALVELNRLADEAKRGNAAAAARLRELSAKAGAAGAGAAKADPQPVPRSGDDDGSTGRTGRAGDTTPLPWALREAVDTYFSTR